jgi:hypothetical protein
MNGHPAAVTDLQPGVVVHGTGLQSAVGIHLEQADVRPVLCGPVTAVDMTGSKMTVLATTVMVNALTELVQEASDHTFTSLTLADFKAGDLVRVFGTAQTDGSVLATRIERRMMEAPGGEELRGTVSDLNTTASTFMLGGVNVSYGSATVRGTLANGAMVEVEGSLSGTTFTATRVEVEDAHEDEPGAAMDLAGPLSNLDTTAKTFTLFAFKVDFSAAAVTGTLTNGAVVFVEGSLSMTDPTTILATKVDVRIGHEGSGACDSEARGAITALDATALTLTVGGKTFWTDAQTVFLRMDATITFADLKVGDQVEVRALSTKTNSAGQAYASRVEDMGMM